MNGEVQLKSKIYSFSFKKNKKKESKTKVYVFGYFFLKKKKTKENWLFRLECDWIVIDLIYQLLESS